MDKLTPKQRLFVAEYLVDKNATQAAIRAGYSQKSAKQMGTENLAKPYIMAAIEEGLSAQQARTNITADRVIQELARIAFLDISKAFDEDGSLFPITNMPEDVRRAIGGMDLTIYREKGEDGGEELTKKVKILEKTKALELLGKHFKLFTDKVQHGGDSDNPITHDHTINFVGK